MTSPQQLRAQKRQHKDTVSEGILLARVSDPRQEDKFSLSSQDREGTSYAAKKSIKIVAKFIFQETASKAQQRKKFDELMRFVYSRPSTKRLALIVEKHDRLLRNDKSKADIRLLVESGRIEVHFFKLGKVLDRTSDPSEFLLDDVMASVNQYQARRTGSEAVKGMVQKAREGWPPYRPPLGYVSIQRPVIGKHSGRDTWEKIVVPDPDKVVRGWLVRMFELRANAVSFRQIRRQCLDEGVVPSNRVGSFGSSFVEQTIKNPFYAGRFSFQGEEYEGRYELIIPPELIERIRNVEGRDTRRKRKRDGALAGWLRCAECGCRITYDPKTKPDGRRYDYYRCSNGKRRHAVLTYSSENKILTAFEPALDAITVTESQAKQIADALNSAHVKTQNAKRAQMDGFRAALKELETAEDELYLDLKKGRLDDDGYKRQLTRVREDRLRFTRDLEDAQRAIDGAYLVTARRVLELAMNARTLWKSRSPREQRDLLDKLLSNPQLDGRTVRYDLRKPFRVIRKMTGTGEWLQLLDSNQRPGG